MGKVTLRDLLTWEKGRNGSTERRVNESLHSTKKSCVRAPDERARENELVTS